MTMFERNKSPKKRERDDRQLNDEVVGIKQEFAVLEKRVDDLEQRLANYSDKANKAKLQFDDLSTRSGRLVACPQCGIISDIEQVPLSGGVFREEAKRCRFCDLGIFEAPILNQKERDKTR